MPTSLARVLATSRTAMTVFRIDEKDGAIRFGVRVQPRAARSEIVGVRGDALKVRPAAPPVDGAANVALVELLAGALGVARRCVRIVSGAASRGKLVEVVGTDVENVRRLARESR